MGESLHNLIIFLAGGKPLTCTLFKYFLRAKLEVETTAYVLGVLDITLLLHTSMNGLNLIQQTEAARIACGFGDTFTFLKNIYSAATRDSIMKIVDFLP